MIKDLLIGISVWVIVMLGMFALTTPVFGYEPSQKLIAYVKQAEGFRATPYKDVTGVLHIGYGHNLEAKKTGYKRISEAEATKLLVKDLKTAYARISVPGRSLNSLSQQQLDILTDYSFHLGSNRKFPKMTKAVLDNNLSAQRQHYKRFAGGRELTGRNRLFYNTFLQ